MELGDGNLISFLVAFLAVGYIIYKRIEKRAKEKRDEEDVFLDTDLIFKEKVLGLGVDSAVKELIIAEKAYAKAAVATSPEEKAELMKEVNQANGKLASVGVKPVSSQAEAAKAKVKIKNYKERKVKDK